jgi:hypothetical protein
LGGGGRPYVRYASNHRDTLHFLTTEDHPRNYDNSIYHGTIRGGRVYRSDGTLVGPLSRTKTTSIRPTDLTRVFTGDADRVAWTVDLQLDRSGRPYAAFSVQMNDGDVREESSAGGQDHRYYYARFDGKQWHVHEMAYAGTNLFTSEMDYTGLVALHPHDPHTVYISTDADPTGGRPLISRADGQRHHEIFRGVTADGGKTWKWTAVTANSAHDNIRPVISPGNGRHTAVLWLRGSYPRYTRYDLDVVGLILER